VTSEEMYTAVGRHDATLNPIRLVARFNERKLPKIEIKVIERVPRKTMTSAMSEAVPMGTLALMLDFHSSGRDSNISLSVAPCEQTDCDVTHIVPVINIWQDTE
jgi:hypothetical protein